MNGPGGLLVVQVADCWLREGISLFSVSLHVVIQTGWRLPDGYGNEGHATVFFDV